MENRLKGMLGRSSFKIPAPRPVAPKVTFAEPLKEASAPPVVAPPVEEPAPAEVEIPKTTVPLLQRVSSSHYGNLYESLNRTIAKYPEVHEFISPDVDALLDKYYREDSFDVRELRSVIEASPERQQAMMYKIIGGGKEQHGKNVVNLFADHYGEMASEGNEDLLERYKEEIRDRDVEHTDSDDSEDPEVPPAEDIVEDIAEAVQEREVMEESASEERSRVEEPPAEEENVKVEEPPLEEPPVEEPPVEELQVVEEIEEAEVPPVEKMEEAEEPPAEEDESEAPSYVDLSEIIQKAEERLEAAREHLESLRDAARRQDEALAHVREIASASSGLE